MKAYEESFAGFTKLADHDRLDNYKTLIEVAKAFIDANTKDAHFAIILAKEILYHRSLMGSSKAYEMAVDLDRELAILSLQIARIAFPFPSKELIPFLESVKYYTTGASLSNLEEEMDRIKSQ
jgi:hypothetical protein